MTDRDLTVKDISTIFGISEVWIRHYARTNKIPASKKGHSWRFNEREVQEALFKPNDYVKVGNK